ncbi:O-methyltransferase [Actinospica robiniae]|uniref:O-methyltransferase n=1 Tax=Actinospica robiniae TaxID=304901 RepID=UPI00040BA90E|nr:class I SAM-dependent methyltransferase [Actinospica robiniae]
MTSLNTLQQPAVSGVLERLFAAADQDDAAAHRAAAAFPAGFEPDTSQERADFYAEVYMPVSPEAGRLLYSLVRATRPRTVVEFGTSFGISTLYLAAAVRDNGAGRVVTTEMSAAKIAAARRTFAEAGLDDVVTLLEGDALETLPGQIEAGVDFVLLDGWKQLYVPVLQLLEPHLAPGTLVLADDTEMSVVKPYLDYVRDPASGYQNTSFPVADGVEISCRL